MKFCILIGTRPGIIKMSPIIRELKKKKENYFVIHTGQHYSKNLNMKILKDVSIDRVKYKIYRPKNAITHAQVTSYMLKKIESILIKDKPHVLLVCGDANTNLAGALAARKLHIKIGHVESGLRSRDWRMPEEHNRVIIDHISDYLFAPTFQSVQNLKKENVNGKIFLVGNTIADSVKFIINNIREKIKKKNQIFFTMHREENVDNKKLLRSILSGIKLISKSFNGEILFPIHPRTYKMINKFNLIKLLSSIKNLKIIQPIGYKENIIEMVNSKLIITDSGGLQEEACILKVPCLTIRDNTERPETVNIGSNIIAGTNSKKIYSSFIKIKNNSFKLNKFTSPYGDGDTSKKIIRKIIND
jgi:UDP-N-acetylglucosamine 2-epimerase (non-hydrolysing)